MNLKYDMILGAVRTNKNGSEATFEICTREEWESMTQEDQDEALIDAANASGVYEIYMKDK